jgi:hypothetical protein
MPARHLSYLSCYAAALLLAGIAVTGCARSGAGEIATGDEPAVVTPVEGSEDLHRIQLTDDAARRIGLTLTTVSAAAGSGRADGAHPEAVAAGAVVYDSSGVTWVYVQQQYLTFQRAEVVVSRIVGDTAMLRSGPPVGSQVALVGVAEIKGAEEGVPGE